MNVEDTINFLRKQFISNLLKAYKNKFIEDPTEITVDDLFNREDRDKMLHSKNEHSKQG